MRNILVIDDEESILDFVKTSLTNFGYNVEIAVDGKDGIEKFKHSFFDAVITDISMPKLDGNGVARFIRKSKRKGTPIIAITGTPWLVEEKAVYFNSVLQKPFTIKTLVDTVSGFGYFG